MRIVCNGADTEINENASLLAYLKEEGLSQKQGIAVAVNETVIPRSIWSETILKNNDNIIVIKATQGG